MYLLLEMMIFQPAMLVYQRVNACNVSMIQWIFQVPVTGGRDYITP